MEPPPTDGLGLILVAGDKSGIVWELKAVWCALLCGAVFCIRLERKLADANTGKKSANEAPPSTAPI